MILHTFGGLGRPEYKKFVLKQNAFICKAFKGAVYKARLRVGGLPKG